MLSKLTFEIYNYDVSEFESKLIKDVSEGRHEFEFFGLTYFVEEFTYDYRSNPSWFSEPFVEAKTTLVFRKQ